MDREQKLIVTFPSTVAAMKMEAVCDKRFGRLIPLPQSIDAGCGLAWSAPICYEEDIMRILKENSISYTMVRVM